MFLCHHKIYFMSFYIRNLINFMSQQTICHELYINLMFLCHHKIYFMSFYIRNLINFMSQQTICHEFYIIFPIIYI